MQKIFKELYKAYGPFLVEWRRGKLFLLWRHHRYLEPARHAPRVFVGKCPTMPNLHQHKPNIFYIYE